MSTLNKIILVKRILNKDSVSNKQYFRINKENKLPNDEVLLSADELSEFMLTNKNNTTTDAMKHFGFEESMRHVISSFQNWVIGVWIM